MLVKLLSISGLISFEVKGTLRFLVGPDSSMIKPVGIWGKRGRDKVTVREAGFIVGVSAPIHAG